MDAKKRIAVIVPAYNVKSHIIGVIQGIPAFVEKIIVVDDASTDGTGEILSKLQNSRVVLVRHEKNQGVGGAMLTGYRAALDLGMEILVKMDGDGQMKSEHLAALIAPVVEGHAHYAKGNRFWDYQSLGKMPFHRRFGNAWLSFLTKMVSGYWNIFDVTNGYTVVLAKTLRHMDLKRVAKGYFFETSMLIELNICGAKVVDVELPSVYESATSHLKPGKIICHFPVLLVKGFFRRFYWRYIVRDFNVLSLCALAGVPLFFFGVFYGASLWLLPPRPGEPTPAGTVMLAALPIILGFQLLLTSFILDVVFIPSKAPLSDE
jgi:glycosyltransferase involved in cell wall biosynthesis